LEAVLPSTALFSLAFRHNAARALMMGVSRGKRNPLWVQRLRAAEMLDSIVKYVDHPLIRETKRECMEDFWDIPSLIWLLEQLQSGGIQLREIYNEYPSPMSLPLRRAAESDSIYNYYPTTSGINEAVSDMLKEAQKIKPAADQLTLVSERKKLPENAASLHSLLMIEGDIIAGEINVPIEWLERLAEQGRALYIEPGLWIAAEHKTAYEKALEGDSFGLAEIIRRTLRYKGAHYPEQLCERYFLRISEAMEILSHLCATAAAVEDNGLYYHGDLYERARNATIRERRREIKTQPSQNYVNLAANALWLSAPPEEQLKKALKDLSEKAYPLAVWEDILLPARVNNYRTDMLNKVLSEGEMFYKLTDIDGKLHVGFHFYEDIDWGAELSPDLEGDESIIYEFLLKRGASFSSGFNSLLMGRDSTETLFSLMKKGLIHSDSFVPVKQWLAKDKTQKATVKQRVRARTLTHVSGRFEVSRPLKMLSREEYVDKIFDKTCILCRETFNYFSNGAGFTWAAALETLRVWEYTGLVRRGYFIEGLSGIQFIREKDFLRTVSALDNNNSDEIIWLYAADPNQTLGSFIPHFEGRDFARSASAAVAIKKGMPVAVAEKSGKALRIFDEAITADIACSLGKAYNSKKIFAGAKKLSIKDYPQEAVATFKDAGFSNVMGDLVLYRAVI